MAHQKRRKKFRGPLQSLFLTRCAQPLFSSAKPKPVDRDLGVDKNFPCKLHPQFQAG